MANWHRRQVSREEKAEWINGLAELYLKQGLKIRGERQTFTDGNTTTNEILFRISQVTGLEQSTVGSYLLTNYKQTEQARTGERPNRRISASKRVENELGPEVVERMRKQVLEEAKLSPEAKVALEVEKQQRKLLREQKQEHSRCSTHWLF